MDLIIYLFVGISSGLLSGLLGIGGGIIIVPALVIILGHNPSFNSTDLVHISAGTSLATMVMTSFSSAYAYHRHKALIWPLFWRMSPGLCIGLMLGKLLTPHLSNTFLAHLLALFLMLIAIHLLWSSKKPLPPPNARTFLYPNYKFSLQHHLILISTSLLIGILSALLGIGGGMLMVPLFLAINLSIREASGTSVLCGFLVSLIGALLLAQIPLSAPTPHTIGYIYWPAVLLISIAAVITAPIGTYLAFRMDPVMLRRLFAMALIFSAGHLCFNALKIDLNDNTETMLPRGVPHSIDAHTQ